MAEPTTTKEGHIMVGTLPVDRVSSGTISLEDKDYALVFALNNLSNLINKLVRSVKS